MATTEQRLLGSLNIPPNPAFSGPVVTFDDSSSWKLTKPLSKLAYQQVNSPFEARQVFLCELLEDKEGVYEGISEAVIKSKYQVQGTKESIDSYRAMVEEYIDKVKRYPDSEPIASGLEDAHELLYLAQHPTFHPNMASKNEVHALRYFGKMGCPSTPHFWAWQHSTVTRETDDIGMGWRVYYLHPDVESARSRLDPEVYWTYPRPKRDEIRAAFKEALIDVWRHKCDPTDSAMRNLMWDDETHRCYIVDFEDYEIEESQDAASQWSDNYYRYWGLAEECRKVYCYDCYRGEDACEKHLSYL